MKIKTNIPNSVTADYIVTEVLSDTYDDAGILREKCYRWLYRVWVRLNLSLIRTSRTVVLPIAPGTKTMWLPPDYEAFLFLGMPDGCGNWLPIAVNRNLMPQTVEGKDICDTCGQVDLCSLETETFTEDVKLKTAGNGSDFNVDYAAQIDAGSFQLVVKGTSIMGDTITLNYLFNGVAGSASSPWKEGYDTFSVMARLATAMQQQHPADWTVQLNPNGPQYGVLAAVMAARNAQCFLNAYPKATGQVYIVTADDPQRGLLTIATYTQTAADTTDLIFNANLIAAINASATNNGYSAVQYLTQPAFYLVARSGIGSTINGKQGKVAWGSQTSFGDFLGGVSANTCTYQNTEFAHEGTHDEIYTKTTTRQIYPDGSYIEEVTQPVAVYKENDEPEPEIEMKTTSRVVCTLDKSCQSCVPATTNNLKTLSNCGCTDNLCCCSDAMLPYDVKPSNVHYNLFEQEGFIQFSAGSCIDKAILKYVSKGCIIDGIHYFPEATMETLIAGTYYRSIEKKKGVAQVEKDRARRAFSAERKELLRDFTKLSYQEWREMLDAIPRIPTL